MIGRTELEQSVYQIGKAEARLAHQRRVVSRLGFDAEPRYADLAKELTLVMEARVLRLLEQHKKLAEDVDSRRGSMAVNSAGRVGQPADKGAGGYAFLDDYDRRGASSDLHESEPRVAQRQPPAGM